MNSFFSNQFDERLDDLKSANPDPIDAEVVLESPPEVPTQPANTKKRKGKKEEVSTPNPKKFDVSKLVDQCWMELRWFVIPFLSSAFAFQTLRTVPILFANPYWVWRLFLLTTIILVANKKYTPAKVGVSILIAYLWIVA